MIDLTFECRLILHQLSVSLAFLMKIQGMEVIICCSFHRCQELLYACADGRGQQVAGSCQRLSGQRHNSLMVCQVGFLQYCSGATTSVTGTKLLMAILPLERVAGAKRAWSLHTQAVRLL